MIGHIFRCDQELVWYYDEHGATHRLTIGVARLDAVDRETLYAVDFKAMLFHGVQLADHKSRNDAHTWCNETLQKNSYAWTGNRFWFDNPQDALLFKMGWG